jgi:hypothetical protein
VLFHTSLEVAYLTRHGLYAFRELRRWATETLSPEMQKGFGLFSEAFFSNSVTDLLHLPHNQLICSEAICFKALTATLRSPLQCCSNAFAACNRLKSTELSAADTPI